MGRAAGYDGSMNHASLGLAIVWLGACSGGDTTPGPDARAVGVDAQVAADAAPACDEAPTGVERSNYLLPFKMPAGLMPDSRFDGKDAKLEIHRVRPLYAR